MSERFWLTNKGMGLALDVLWNTAVASTFAFGLVVASMFTIGLAADYNLISLQKHCHYLSGNQNVDGGCR